ncbi:MAG: hypothetical protein JSR98_12655 [Proteobacteria bacterium]|nr:hypothetical protein [Pseudomonadota bacterium]
MIALLLSAQILAGSALAATPPSPPQPSILRPSNELIRVLPGKQVCMDHPGQVEVSLKTTPTALYRQGDRPAKGLRKWADYPDGALCAVEAGR